MNVHVGAALGYAGLVVAVLAVAAGILLAVRRGRGASVPVVVALAGIAAIAGVGDAAYWGYRDGPVAAWWFVVAAAAGALAGAAPAASGLLRREGALADYRVEGIVGAGSFGTVYRAVDRRGEHVALKVLAPELAEDDEFRARFRTEASILRSLDHPNCVGIRDVVDDGELLAIVSDYVDGASLHALVERSGPLDGSQIAHVMAGALDGLAHAHARGLVHRDVKPENILVDRHGNSMLIDFGLARGVGALARGSEPSVGSPAYMSPEQIRGEPLDARTDIYAVGAVLFELLTGSTPFDAPTVDGMLEAHRTAPVPDPRERLPGLPGDLSDLVMRALAKDPADRPATAEELRSALGTAATHAFGAEWGGPGVAAALGASAAAATGALAGAAAGAGGGAAAAAGAAGSLAGQAGTSGVAAAETVLAAVPSAADAGSRRVPASLHELRSGGRAGRPSTSGAGPAVAAAVLAVATVATLGVGAAAGGTGSPVPPTPHHPVAGSPASCIVGTWIFAGGVHDDEWNGIPVLVSAPGSGPRNVVRYRADGTWVSIDPPGEAPAVGRLKGAVFVDHSYGITKGRWRASGNDELVESDLDLSHGVTTLYAGYQHTSSPGLPLQTGTVTLKVSCTPSTLVEIDDFTYRGKKLSSDIRYSRVPSGTLPPPAPVFDQAGQLGPLSLDGYCAADVLRGSRATHTGGLAGKGAANHNWACRKGKTVRPVDLTQACQWSFPLATHVHARAVNPDDATSWLCYGGPAATMTVTPRSGGSGTTIAIRSRTPCPSTTQGLTVELVPLKPSPITSGQGRPLRGGGAWTADIPVGPFGTTGPPPPPVQASVEAWCSLPHGLYQEYEPVPFRYTGGRAAGKGSA